MKEQLQKAARAYILTEAGFILTVVVIGLIALVARAIYLAWN
jgi:hypothetical protein